MWETIRVSLEAWAGKPESWVAIYAAVVSTITLLWNALRDLLSLRVRASAMVTLGEIDRGNDLRVFVLVANKSLSREFCVTHVIATHGRFWRTRKALTWVCHWLHLPIWELTPAVMFPQAPTTVIPGHPLSISCALGIPEDWLQAKRIGVITAEGRHFWCSRASMRRFREAVEHEAKEWKHP
ncbi:MAG: hypothetical protein LC804_09890 [Acidobacteria bacterium]|nr:hypothetical protein [Acidobacteriota bacterium]